MSSIGLLVVLATVTVTSVAQLCMKIGVGKASLSPTGSIPGQVLNYLLSPYVSMGLVLYGVGTIMWLFALSKFELSFVYPFVGLSFVLVVLFGAVFLNENLSLLRILGVALIVLGTVIVSQST